MALFPDRAASLRLTAEAGLALLLYDWPLNVRELEKALRSAVALAGEAAIEPKHLPEEVRDTLSGAPAAAERSTASAAPGDVTPVREAHKEQRRQQIIAVLREHKGVVSEAARAMGQHRRQLQRWIADLGIRPDEFKE